MIRRHNTSLVIWIVATLLAVQSAQAQVRTPQQMRQIAINRLKTDAHAVDEVTLSQYVADKVVALQAKGGSSEAFRVFSESGRDGFVIVSADERMRPILGESRNGRIDADSLPCGLIALMAHYADQYAALQDGEAEPMADAGSNGFYAEVQPLIASRWGQDSPYNDNCPKGTPSGCVATAMAQIMKLYKYPQTGSGSFSYISRSEKYRLRYDFGAANFDWEALTNRYSPRPTGEDSESRAAVANLMEACGVSVGMDYAEDGSGAYDADVPYALINFFDYNSTVACYERSYFSNEEWYEKVHEELDASRPILYCGQDTRSYGGHAFIVDGYRQEDGKFHLNWGWDGQYDGYYELDALDPGTYRFAASQSMVVRFCPDETGTQEDVFYAETFTVTKEIEKGQPISCVLKDVVNVSNSSSYVVEKSSFSGTVGVALYDSDLNFVRTLKEEDVSDLRTFYGYDELSFTVPYPAEDSVADETYYIVPFAKAADSATPTPIRTLGGKTDRIAIGKTSGDSGGDDRPNDNVEVILQESFEDFDLPEGWIQEQVLGKGEWQCRMVLQGNDNSSVPPAHTGRGYAFLSYNSGTAFANTRTVTMLQIPQIEGGADGDFLLQLQCRKYASRAGVNDILSVYINRGNGWEVLADQQIANSSQWLPIEIPYSANGAHRLAFEGSIEYGSQIYIDDVRVLKDETMPVAGAAERTARGEEQTFNALGLPYGGQGRGVHIERDNNGNTRKVIR